ncbi:hypothetical protein PhaeoP72_01045 [Phaeobacter inhibens]|nr:hypothetical protein PhaeoP72_01045 [Phaeobacter inhibens]
MAGRALSWRSIFWINATADGALGLICHDIWGPLWLLRGIPLSCMGTVGLISAGQARSFRSDTNNEVA